MHQQKDTKLNAEDREPLKPERVERKNMLSFTVNMVDPTNGKWKGVHSTSTSRIRCPFQATLRRNQSDVPFTLSVDNTTHNHAASEDVAAYAASSTLSYEQLLTAKQLSKAVFHPKSILTTLRQTDPSCKAILQDIYNIKTKAKNELLAGRLPLDAFWTY